MKCYFHQIFGYNKRYMTSNLLFNTFNYISIKNGIYHNLKPE